MPGRPSARDGPTTDVVLDCRWFGIGGAGRVTEHLLRGLSQDPPDARWALWGPPEVEDYRWPGAGVVVTRTDPRELAGQRSWFDIPPGRLRVFLHQARPLRRLPAVTMVYDTIPLRHGSNRLRRRAGRAYLRRAVALSRHVVTVSDYARECIRRDLGVPPHRISVLPLPVDEEMAARVSERRRRSAPAATALFIGRFAPHKNIDRLLSAFEITAFRETGGRLVLVGGSPAEVQRVRSRLTPRQRRFVEVRGRCDQGQLEELMASARLLVQPSLEEGFGLPVLDALAGGLPVCVSDGGALPEIVNGLVTPFSATSIDGMVRAIDVAASGAVGSGSEAASLAAEVRRRFPTVIQYARRFRLVVEAQLEP